MKKIALLLSISLLLAATSCKKKNDDPDSNTPDPTPTLAKHPDGYLKHFQSVNITSDSTPVKSYRTFAYFYSSNTASDLVSIDSMSLNGIYLKRLKDSSYYSTATISGAVCNWHIEGKRGIPDFDYTNFAIPDYANYASIPDSVNTKNDLILSLAGAGKFTSSNVTIFDVLGKNFSKEVKPGDTNVTFTATELSTFNKYANFYIHFTFVNTRIDTISGKAFHFENQLTLDKYLTPYQ